jgi:hypothetical protein
MQATPTNESSVFDPSSMPVASLKNAHVVWYRRPWVLVTTGILFVVAISVITDLPHPLSRAQDIDSQNASMKLINSDIKPCTFALQQSFTIYREDLAGQLTLNDRAQAPSLLSQDQTACSFASGSTYDLTQNIQVLDTNAGKHIDSMLSDVTLWVTSDAVATMQDIQYLYNHPGNAKKLADLANQERNLDHDRSIARADVQKADAILRTSLTEPALPAIATS